MTLEEQLKQYCSEYNLPKDINDFYDRLIASDKLIHERCKNSPKFIYDVFGRIYIYDKENKLEQIKLDEYTWKITKKIANFLI